MSVIGSNILAGASGGAVTELEFRIERSLRFNSADSAYLNRTPSSAGNRRTWTWSGWVKKCVNTTAFPPPRILGAGVASTGEIGFTLNGDRVEVYRYAGSYTFQLITSAKLRDPSAWYHLVIAFDTTQSTASDRIKIYINGVEQSDFDTSSYPPTQNADYEVNNTSEHRLGHIKNGGSSDYFSGHLAEVHLIDGQRLAATDFGEYDDDNVWQPIEYAGTYGTNGFYLDFSDNTSTTTVAEDSSGNSNDWTANNFSVASGAGNDSLIDSPMNYTASSGNNGGNYATLNPLQSGATLTNGNLDATSGTNTAVFATIPVGETGKKFYWEATINGSNFQQIGIADIAVGKTNAAPGDSGSEGYILLANGDAYHEGSTTSTGNPSYTTGDIVGVKYDDTTRSLSWNKNGGSFFGAVTVDDGRRYAPVFGAGGGSDQISVSVNFGQRPFAYTPPTGHVSLCTTNLSDPTIADGSTVMDAVLWSGDGVSGRDITGLSFAPDLVWIKRRNSGIYWNVLFDSIRGGEQLSSNETDAGLAAASNVAGYVSAYNSDGFELTEGSLSIASVNATGGTYVGWSWDGGTSTVSNTDGTITSSVRANSSAGFSIVSWSGSGSNATIGHGLNAAPYFITAKCRNAAPTTWLSYHNSLGATKYIELNNTNAAATASTVWNNTDPASSVFSVGTSSGINQSGRTYIAYCFAPVEGYSAMGTYTGNGNADGPFIFTGMRSKWILIKRTDTSGNNWVLHDTERDTYNAATKQLLPSTSGSETNTSVTSRDIVSNGFKLRGTNAAVNASGATYIYMAFAEHPFKTARAR